MAITIQNRIATLKHAFEQAWEHPRVNKDFANAQAVVEAYAIKHFGESLEVREDLNFVLAECRAKVNPQPSPQPSPQPQQPPPQPQYYPQPQPSGGGSMQFPPVSSPVVSSGSAGVLVQQPQVSNIDQMGHVIAAVWKKTMKLKDSDITYQGSKTISRWHQLFFDRDLANVPFKKLIASRNDLIHVGIDPQLEIEQRPGHVVVTIANPDWEPVSLLDSDDSGTPKYVRIGQPSHPAKPLAVPVGINMDGNAVRLSLDTVLIGGMRGGGKSSLQKLIPAALMLENPPWQVKFLMIETVKGVGMTTFQSTPWSWAGTNGSLTGVINDPELALSTIRETIAEFEEARYSQLRRAGVESIEEYNSMMATPKTMDEFMRTPIHQRPMYRLVVNIEEIASLVDLYEDTFVKALISRTEQSRAAGILWVLGTQRPDQKVIHPRIGQNMAVRVAVMSGTQRNYRVVLGTTDTNDRIPELHGHGEAILRHKGQNQRIQTLYADNGLIKKIVESGRKKYGILSEGLA
jgi:FtsK/SpoIIIE family